MIAAGMDWQASPAGLRCGALALSFQRFARPASGEVGAAPSSLGALAPMPAGTPGRFLLPVADEEAFWIGLSADEGRGFAVELSALPRGSSAGAATPGPVERVPPVRRIAGLRRPDGRYAVFARAGAAGIAALRIRAWPAAEDPREAPAAEIALVDHAGFAERARVSPPGRLDPDAGYRGYRLP
ncbi:hypothetical protein [Labrys wisconsinensis]|uniref:Phytase-like domain-containing protein n=1 Tax=Labrys wisconsinensis TaxID=425677 RepID=A0ABU0JGN5_9HYPH|nr:hypothetical protein [Labrys wisconsinensis]MDQ0473448.1 hypothetical protein [Labrys wisconsinensis]